MLRQKHLSFTAGILILLTICSPLWSNAQFTEVSFKIITKKNEPVSWANIEIRSLQDSTIRFKSTADSAGIIRIPLSTKDAYSILVSAISFQPYRDTIQLSDTLLSYSIKLEPEGKLLETAVIRSSRPLIRQEDDKVIVDPESLAAASTSGYEVMEKTPGLFVDQDGNIYISSLIPATVQINGRDMRMSAADMASILKSLPPNAIQQIEIVKTPSAKYDAASSGGVVNVVLRKGVKIGITGSVNTGWQQGVYGNKFVGFNLNKNNARKSAYINLNYTRRNSYEKIVTDRLFAPDTMLSQRAYTSYPGDIFSGNYAFTRNIGKWELELSGQASLNNNHNETDNTNIIHTVSTSEVISNSSNNVGNRQHSLVIGNGFETKLKIDSAGSEWSTQLFYFNSTNTADQLYSTETFIPVQYTAGGDGTLKNHRDLFSARTDYRQKLKKRITIESGLKSTVHLYRNRTQYFTEINGVRSSNAARTNSFNYTENINAAYFQASKTFSGNVILKAGTRIENTNMRGQQALPSDTGFAIHRTDLFPYIYLSRPLLKIAGYELRGYLVYRRSITRPVYEQLNPFSRYVDAYLSEQGNPSLKPQFTTNYEANISVDERPILAVGINDTKDIFTNVVYQSDSSSLQAYRTYDNLGKNKEWYMRALGALPPGGRYFFVLGGQFNHNFYDGIYENKPLNYKRGSWTLFTYHTLKLDRYSVLTVNGFVRFSGQQQFYELGTFGMLNASINRRFMKEKLTVTISMNDIFLTNRNNFTIKQGSVSASGYRQADTRRGGINIRYNFGIRKKEEQTNPFSIQPAG